MNTPEEKGARLVRTMLTAPSPALVKARQIMDALTAPSPALVKARQLLKNLRDNDPIDSIDVKAIIDRNWKE